MGKHNGTTGGEAHGPESAAGLPSRTEMYQALLARDPGYEGIFVVGVRTTGIFCRPTCPARKPRPENVEFFTGTRDALFAGYRPCRRCRPLMPAGGAPNWLRPLLLEMEEQPGLRLRDGDLRRRGIDPTRVRRWFQANHGMTFQAYQRGLRLGGALTQLREGSEVTEAAYDSGYESLSGFHEAVRQLTGTTPARNRGALQVTVTRILTPLGPMMAAATDQALCLLEFADRRMLARQLERLVRRTGGVLTPGGNDVLRRAEEELTAYFAGERRAFEVPLAPAGTSFQQAVWRVLTDIPYGATRSYAEQAAALGQPRAVRAVARANGDNPIAILIPCHRVVGSDGKLTGYGGGLWRKRRLLELERQNAGTGQATLAL